MYIERKKERERERERERVEGAQEEGRGRTGWRQQEPGGGERKERKGRQSKEGASQREM